MTSDTPCSTLSHVRVERTDEKALEIVWEAQAPDSTVCIHAGETPESIDRTTPVATVRGRNRVRVPPPADTMRMFYEVSADGGPGRVVAERLVPVEGTFNFRDMGGYRAIDGRRVKWGQVYRSDSLNRITDTGRLFLKHLGIRLVCDFRTPAEAAKSPDLLPEDDSVGYLHLPIIHGELDVPDAMARIRRGDISWLDSDFMTSRYLRNIEEFGPTWGTVLHRLSRAENRALVFHCTAGKDRAGVCAALILLALGVPEETVLYDHGLSNVYVAHLLDRIFEKLRSWGVDADRAAPYFTAPREAMVAMLDHIRATYGSAATYLTTKAEVPEEVLVRLREELLE